MAPVAFGVKIQELYRWKIRLYHWSESNVTIGQASKIISLFLFSSEYKTSSTAERIISQAMCISGSVMIRGGARRMQLLWNKNQSVNTPSSSALSMTAFTISNDSNSTAISNPTFLISVTAG